MPDRLVIRWPWWHKYRASIGFVILSIGLAVALFAVVQNSNNDRDRSRENDAALLATVASGARDICGAQNADRQAIVGYVEGAAARSAEALASLRANPTTTERQLAGAERNAASVAAEAKRLAEALPQIDCGGVAREAVRRFEESRQ